MNQSVLLAFLQETYLLPALHHATPVAVGYLSQNWVITAGNERYFLKQYRFDDVTRVIAAHAALLHFHGTGLPAILPLTTRDGQRVCTMGDHHYTLFPLIAGRQLRRGAMPMAAIQSMGAMLARLHRAGHNVQVPHLRQWRLKADRSLFVADASAILDRIVQQPTLTPFDLLAEQAVRLQLALVARTPMDPAALTLQPDHLVHGDYHDGNLFFNEADEVAYLFDWEKAEIAPREVELVRALLFTCFSNPDNFRGTFLPHNFKQATVFLAAYHAQYPIEPERFIDALRARYWGSLCSLWVVTEHYLHQNTRVDTFLESNLAEISYFADHLPEMIVWFHSLVSRQFMQ